jgi:ribonuclease Z
VAYRAVLEEGRSHVSVRELVVLGTASQVPTRRRAHNGLLLRWDDHGILVDPGEGTQRQLTLAGVASTAITRICITHAHGDHCFGLPGVAHRMSLDGVRRGVDVHHAAGAAPVVEALLAAAPDALTPMVPRPTPGGEVVSDADGLRVVTAPLAHSLPTVGYRFEEPDGWRLLPDRLEELGVHGPARERLRREGEVVVGGGRRVRLEQAAVERAGQRAAVVMDTRWCDGALELAEGVDLLVVEATFLDSERELAEEVGHLTAGQAARLGVEAGARRVVLTHFSQRYPTTEGHLDEARAAGDDLDLIVADDLTRVPVPARR